VCSKAEDKACRKGGGACKSACSLRAQGVKDIEELTLPEVGEGWAVSFCLLIAFVLSSSF
jgi:hypothetical protein